MAPVSSSVRIRRPRNSMLRVMPISTDSGISAVKNGRIEQEKQRVGTVDRNGNANASQ